MLMKVCFYFNFEYFEIKTKDVHHSLLIKTVHLND
jgi:hypothetical protein